MNKSLTVFAILLIVQYICVATIDNNLHNNTPVAAKALTVLLYAFIGMFVSFASYVYYY
jgi:hypothetical protein